MAEAGALGRAPPRTGPTGGSRAETLAAAVVCLAAVGGPHAVGAQEQRAGGRGARWELRADAIVAHRTAIHGGVGVSLPVGTYLRVGGVGGAGALLRSGGAGSSARADLLAHFLLDPFGQLRRSPYAGGGVTVRHDEARTRGALVAVVGVEGRARGGYAPAFELGLGSGVRIGVVLRQSRAPAR